MVKFAPESVGLITGLGMPPDFPLAAAFVRQALMAGFEQDKIVVPALIDVIDDRLSVIPPVDIQAERAQPALKCDLVVVLSAGTTAACIGLNGLKLRKEQLLVCVNPSARNPATTFNFAGKAIDDARGASKISNEDELAMVAAALKGHYEPPKLVMPGLTPNDRLIAVSNDHLAETSSLDPPKMFAELLNAFAIHGGGAWIKSVRVDDRLDRGVDYYSKQPHSALLAATRALLAHEVWIGVEQIDDTRSHYFTGNENEVMADILTGNLFKRPMSEIWTQTGVHTPATIYA
ncbi:MAG TPA: hypothetical protein VLG47_02540 [Candidatus Saccharimonadales bacterium]|nr:hypothetical protein [Candidatus Saccharimonadales bacterium]